MVAKTFDTIVSRLAGKAGEVGLAVFIKPNGEFKLTMATSALFNDVMRIHPERLVGIYDEDAEERWILDDLTWAAKNMVEA